MENEQLQMRVSRPRTLSFDLTHLSVIDDGKVQEYEKQLEKERLEQEQKRYENSGVPSKFYHTSLDSYIAATEEEIRNKKIAENFAKNPKNRILIMCGNNGNGKSLLGCGILRVSGGLYVLASDLCIEYEAGTSYHTERTRPGTLKYYSSVKVVLVIDESGKYSINPELEKFLIAYIVCIRYENNLSTVLITNANKKEYIEFLGKSVFDRLTEVCTTLEFTGTSKRRGLRNDTSAAS